MNHRDKSVDEPTKEPFFNSSSKGSENLSRCLNVTEALLFRDTSRTLALDIQRAKSYRSVKKLQEKSRSLRFAELYGPDWNSSNFEKLRHIYKRKFVESKINDDNFGNFCTMLLKVIFCLLLTMEEISSMGLPRKLQNRFGSMKEKMNKLMKQKKGNELFLNINELEYPKANQTLRRVYREQWNEYYDCLKNRVEDAGPEKTTYPVALLALEGTFITLKCKLCVSPAEMHTSESIEWLYNSSSNGSIANTPIETSSRVIVTPDERDLNLYNVQLAEAGIYWCHLEDTASAPYYLHVVNEETELTRPVRPETANKAENFPVPPEYLDKYGLRVYSLWSTWSSCTACGRVGQRIRYGYCTISLIENGAHRYNVKKDASLKSNEKKDEEHRENEKRESNESEEENEKENETKSRDRKRSILSPRHKKQVLDVETTKDSSETITSTTEEIITVDNEDEPEDKKDNKSPEELKNLARSILPIFRNRLPCRSPQTPKDIRKIQQIGERKTEIMTGFCKIKCEKEVVFEIRDKSGNILESANNSAGIFSMVQGMPEPRPSVERITIYRRHEKKAELTCPGNLNSDVPVIWKIGTKILVPSMIKRETDERISIDSRQRILIKKIRFADSNIYSCWQRGELAGTIRLQVTDEVELKVDHRVFMIGGITIVSVMLMVFWRAFKGRKRFTKH